MQRFNRIMILLRITALILIIHFNDGCSLTEDNATKLAYQLQSISKNLNESKIGSEYAIKYMPVENKSPYIILLLSTKGLAIEELYSKGIDSSIVKDLYPQLSYIDLKKRAALIVYQNKQISFTTYHLRFVDVSSTQIISGKGEANLIVKKTDNGICSINGDKISIIELRKKEE